MNQTEEALRRCAVASLAVVVTFNSIAAAEKMGRNSCIKERA